MNKFVNRVVGLALVAALLVVSSCEYGQDGAEKNVEKATSSVLLATLLAADTASFSLAGSWTDNYGGTETITLTGSTGTWVDFLNRSILEYDASAGILYYSFPRANCAYSCGSCAVDACYGRIEWIPVAINKMYFCESAYNLGSLAAAKAAAGPAIRSSAPDSGCSGFAWTTATK